MGVRLLPVFIIWLSVALAGQSQPGRVAFGSSAISGQIVDRQTQRPVAEVIVTLFAVPSGTLLAKTDSEGRYAFEHLAAGEYRLQAWHPEYVREMFGWIRSAPEPIIRLAAKERRADVDFTLARGGSVTGRVTNASGEPVKGSRLSAHQQIEDRGFRTISIGFEALTDEEGRYRLTDLAEGTYIIAATWMDRDGLRTNSVDQQVYYPGVDERKDATAVRIAAGENVGKVDIVMTTTTLARLTGHVLRGNGEGSIYAYLLSSGQSTQTIAVDDEGRFSTPRVKPGRHTLVTRSQGGIAPEAAVLTVELTGEMTGVQLALAPTGTIAGRVVADDGSNVSDTLQIAGVLADEAKEIDPLRRDRVDIGEGGAFELKGMIGERILQVINLDVGWSVDRVLLGKTPVKSVTVDAGQTIDEVTIVVTRR